MECEKLQHSAVNRAICCHIDDEELEDHEAAIEVRVTRNRVCVCKRAIAIAFSLFGERINSRRMQNAHQQEAHASSFGPEQAKID